MFDLITASIGKLEELRSSLRDQPVEELAARSGELVELVCLLGALAGNRDLRCSIAKDSRSPAAVLRFLVGHESEEVRIAVAGNPSTPPETLAALARSDLTRRAVAGNPGAPLKVLVELAGHWDLDVRTRVSYNPSTPEGIRRDLRGAEIPPEVHPPQRRSPDRDVGPLPGFD